MEAPSGGDVLSAGDRMSGEPQPYSRSNPPFLDFPHESDVWPAGRKSSDAEDFTMKEAAAAE